jgi:hypothetical protein
MDSDLVWATCGMLDAVAKYPPVGWETFSGNPFAYHWYIKGYSYMRWSWEC